MEVRVDYLKGEAVLYSNSRKHRPHNFNLSKTMSLSNAIDCPFCKENKKLVEDIIMENSTGSRIVRNIFPMVDGELGTHDVAIESYDHDLRLKDMKVVNFSKFLQLVQLRCKEHENLSYTENVQVFKNSGPLSGASLKHSHWQILSTNFVPNKVRTITNNFNAYKNETGKCYLCEEGEVIKLLEDENMILGIPKASYGGLSFRVFPKLHISSFLDLDENSIRSLCEKIIYSLNLIDELDKESSYNILFFSKPKNYKDKKFHFFVDIVNRKGSFGGFELSTGEFINSVLPEDLYKKIKEIREV